MLPCLKGGGLTDNTEVLLQCAVTIKKHGNSFTRSSRIINHMRKYCILPVATQMCDKSCYDILCLRVRWKLRYKIWRKFGRLVGVCLGLWDSAAARANDEVVNCADWGADWVPCLFSSFTLSTTAFQTVVYFVIIRTFVQFFEVSEWH